MRVGHVSGITIIDIADRSCFVVNEVEFVLFDRTSVVIVAHCIAAVVVVIIFATIAAQICVGSMGESSSSIVPYLFS